MILNFDNVELKRDGFTFFLNVEFRENGIYGIIGPNGSGKTTFIELATGIIKPDSGGIFYEDKALTKICIEKRRELFSATYINENPIPGFTVLDYLTITTKEREIKPFFLAKFGRFSNFLNKDIKKLSQGQWIMVQIIENLLQSTPVVFLDEVILFLDIRYKHIMFEYLKQSSSEKKIFVISHDIGILTKNSDFIFALENGKQSFLEKNSDFDPEAYIQKMQVDK